MANCGFKIIRPATSSGDYTIGINVDETNFSDTTYQLNVNGSAKVVGGIYSSNNIRIQETANNSTAVYFGINNLSTATSDHRLMIHEFPYNTSGTRINYYERYSLPVPTTTITENKRYDILTSKNAVTIAQGGTGETTATEAWTALGGGASGKHADSYFALSDHTHNAATTTVAGFVSTGAQTWAGTKTFNGDIEIESGFYIKGSTSVWWKKPNLTTGSNAVAITAAGMATNSSAPYFYVTEYAYTTAGARSTYYENYRLPSPASTITANATYDILTTKTMASYSSATLSYVTNSHLASIASFTVYRTGRLGILLAYGATLAAYSSSGYVTIGTLPVGYRPVTTIRQRIPLASGNWICSITSAGNVQVLKSTTETGTVYFVIPFPLSY